MSGILYSKCGKPRATLSHANQVAETSSKVMCSNFRGEARSKGNFFLFSVTTVGHRNGLRTHAWSDVPLGHDFIKRAVL